MTDRLPPQSIEAECALLGAMLLSPVAIDAGASTLKANDFYSPAHRKIFQAIIDLNDKTVPIDIVSLPEYLNTMGQLKDIGGRLYLTGLMEAAPTIANAEHYAEMILGASIRNNLITTANTILSYAYDISKTTDEIIETAENALYQSANRKATVSYIDSLTGVHDGMKYIEQLKISGMLGILTGFNQLNYFTKGFRPGDLIVIAGRPSVGKSVLARNTIERAIFTDHLPRAVFSLEVSREDYFANLLSGISHINYYDDLTDADWKRLSNAAGKIANELIYFNDETDITPARIKSITRLLKQKHNIASVYVDYLQLVEPGVTKESRNLEVGYMSRKFKIIAKELKIPVIVLSQLSRAGDNRPPLLTDLRDSGSIEQDADLVIFIHRERDENNIYLPEAKILIAKQRKGPTGSFDLNFIKEHISFEEPEYKHKNDPQYYKGGE